MRVAGKHLIWDTLFLIFECGCSGCPLSSSPLSSTFALRCDPEVAAVHRGSVDLYLADGLRSCPSRLPLLENKTSTRTPRADRRIPRQWLVRRKFNEGGSQIQRPYNRRWQSHRRRQSNHSWLPRPPSPSLMRTPMLTTISSITTSSAMLLKTNSSPT